VYLLRLFGEPRLTADAERPLPLGPVATALLALLARSAGRSVGREWAAALLWPDAEPAAARRALRQLLFRIRAHAPTAVVADRQRLTLGSDVTVDVEAFEHAAGDGRSAEAAALYEPFLTGLTLPGCSAFEQWADGERAALRAAAAGVFERLADEASARGAWQEARAVALRWLATEPYSERAAARAIAAAAQVEGRAAALAEWEAFRQRLKRELGTAPSPALVQLAERLRQDNAPTMSPSAHRAPPGASLTELPFLGREAEFARLSECWRQTVNDRRQLVLLRGEPGIGKTRLAGELADWTASLGATVLRARAYEVEAGVPYATLAGALRGALRAPGLAGVEERTLTELGRIVPEFTTRFAGIAADGAASFETGTLRIMDALRDLLDSLAHEAPVLIFIDDLPWADDATVATLHYAWRTLPDRPLMILATARGSSAAELLGAEALVAAAIRESGACTRIDVGPLGHTAIEALTRHALPEHGPAAAHSVEVRSGGNPLFLCELLRAAGEGCADVPSETIRLVARGRISALGDESRALLQAAAVLGRQFPLPVAGGVADLDAATAADAVDGLVARGLMRQVAYGYDFVHDVVRETVLDDLGPETRRLLHSRAFAGLRPADGDAGGVGADRAGALAHHAAAAGLRGEAHHWYLHTARAAIDLFAPAEADRALARALSYADDDPQRTRAWTAIAELARVRSDFRSAAYAFRRAYESTTDAGGRLRLKLRMLHMGECAGLLALPDVEALADELRTDAERAGKETLGELLFIEADAAVRFGDDECAALRIEAATEALRSAGSPRFLARALLLHAGVSARRGADALSLLAEAESVASKHALGTELSDVRLEIATELSRLGRWDEALAGFAGVIVEAGRGGDFGNIPIARLNAADLHTKRGEWEEARAHIIELESICARFNFPHVTAATMLNAGLLEWYSGDLRRAQERAHHARNAADSAGIHAAATAAAALEALCLIEDGAVAEAAALLEHSDRDGPVRHATWSDDAELVVAARARLLAARGDRDAAIALLEESRQTTREPYADALLTVEQGALLAAAQPDEAASLASAAIRTAQALGARPLEARARAVLELGGITGPGQD
jgi:DNA-binding SARP family transcriptional activator/tetratricopeptide (TPR) repeat protein